MSPSCAITGPVPGRVGVGLAHALVREIDVELVDLAIHGDLAAVAVERHARVAQPHVAVHALGDRAGDDGDPEVARPALHGGEARAVERLRGRAQLVGRAERLPALGQQRDVGARRRGVAHEPLGASQVVVGRGPGAQLDARDARVHGCTLEFPAMRRAILIASRPGGRRGRPRGSGHGLRALQEPVRQHQLHRRDGARLRRLPRQERELAE